MTAGACGGSGHGRQGRAAAALLRAAALVMVALSGHLQSALAAKMVDPSAPPLAIPCDCSDIDPRDSFLNARVGFVCFDQARFGACNQSFILETPGDIPEGYCQISCGRCGCCPTLDQVLEAKGLNMFRWVLGFSEQGANAALPGYMVTLLAPTDGAVWAAINRLGYSSKEAVEADGNAKNILADVGRYHVLPPVQPLNATWTAPFMRRNAQIWTALAGQAITANRDDSNGRVQLTSAKSSAGVIEQDVYACKGFVQVLDSVLVPWSMAGYP